MSMIEVKTTISNNTLEILSNGFKYFTDKNAAQATKGAFMRGAKLIEGQWKAWAGGASIPGADDIKNPSQNLAQSIKTHEIGPFTVEIGTNSPNMERIVKGQKAFDMKDTYPFGRKSRRTKDGRGYLIIPFSWGTPDGKTNTRAHYRNIVPQQYYKEILKYRATIISKETHLEPNYKGQMIERWEYFWGDRLRDEDAGNANGMIRTSDGSSGHKHFTFRVITEKNSMNAEKWWKKAVPPNDVPMALVQNHEKQIADLVEHGILEDLGLDAE